MAQPFFTNAPVNIGQLDTTPYLQAGRAYGMAFEKLGQSVAGAMERQEQKRIKDEEKSAVAKILKDQFELTDEEANIYAAKPEVFMEGKKALREQQKMAMEQERNAMLNYLTEQTALEAEERVKEVKRKQEAEESFTTLRRQALNKEAGTPFADRTIDVMQRSKTPYKEKGYDPLEDPMRVFQPKPFEYTPDSGTNAVQTILSSLKQDKSKPTAKTEVKFIEDFLSKQEKLDNVNSELESIKGLKKEGWAVQEDKINKLEKQSALMSKMLEGKKESILKKYGKDEPSLAEYLLTQTQGRSIAPEVIEKPTTEIAQEVVPGIDPSLSNLLDYAIKTGQSPETIKLIENQIKESTDFEDQKKQLDIANKTADLQLKLNKLGTSAEIDLSEQEGKTWNALTRMDFIENELKSLGADFGYGSEAVNKFNLNYLKEEERQIYEAYRDNWISANLRKESGAAISESEMEGARKQYFPVVGDSRKTAEAKKKLRQKQRDGYYGTLPEGVKRKYNKNKYKSLEEPVEIDPNTGQGVINGNKIRVISQG